MLQLTDFLSQFLSQKIEPQGYFITGTDTGCGKTYITQQLIRAFQQQGQKVNALKPIASGVNEQGVNEDACLLAQASFTAVDRVNPICFQQPIAPSIAAEQENYHLTVQSVWQACQSLLQKPADVTLIEGVGGLAVPLNQQETVIDLIKQFNFPVILVVGLRLGCLNHAILTYQALKEANIEIAGWIANQIDPAMDVLVENVETLKSFLKVPFWGLVDFQ